MAASALSSSAGGRVAIVTGANKGIGYCIAQQLAESGKFSRIILGCRSEERGHEAAAKLGGITECAKLDLADSASIDAFAADIQSRVGRCDVLVNNGAIAFKGSDPTPFKEQTEPTLRSNYYGTVRLTQNLLPLIKATGENPQVVNVASMAGKLAQIRSEQLRDAFTAPTLTKEGLDELVGAFASAVAAGNHAQQGWGNSNYGFSKLAVIAYTKMLAREQSPGPVKVNCCCPGYCSTDMSSHGGSRTASDGARNAVMLALQEPGPNALNGEFIQDWAVGSW